MKWGADLSIVLRSLPALLLSPLTAIFLPRLLARAVLPDASYGLLKAFLGLPVVVRAAAFWMFYVFFCKVVRQYQRRADRRRLGPNVIEVSRIKLKWPWNLDLIPFAIHNRQTDYCAALWGRIASEYGYTFNMGLFGEDQIITFEPEHIKVILSTDFSSYEKGPLFREKMNSVLGKGVFNADGDMWKFHRGMSRPYFSRYRISHFDNFARHSDLAISKVLSRLKEPARLGLPVAVDFQDLVARFTLDSGTEFLFGRDAHSLKAPSPYPHEKPKDHSTSFAAAFGRAQDLLTHRLSLGHLWSWMELFWNRTEEEMKIIDAYVTPIMKKKLEDKRAPGPDDELKTTSENSGAVDLEEAGDILLDHLVQCTDDISVIKDELFNILVAVRDTVRSNHFASEIH